MIKRLGICLCMFGLILGCAKKQNTTNIQTVSGIRFETRVECTSQKPLVKIIVVPNVHNAVVPSEIGAVGITLNFHNNTGMPLVVDWPRASINHGQQFYHVLLGGTNLPLVTAPVATEIPSRGSLKTNVYSYGQIKTLSGTNDWELKLIPLEGEISLGIYVCSPAMEDFYTITLRCLPAGM